VKVVQLSFVFVALMACPDGLITLMTPDNPWCGLVTLIT
jgi:hypothetical protein